MKKSAIAGAAAALLLAGCTTPGVLGSKGVDPLYSFPVTSNETPYSQCLSHLASLPGDNLPTFAVGEVADKTGQINYNENGHQLTQGVSEMVVSALYKTKKARLVERMDLRIPLAEVRLAEQGRLSHGTSDYTALPASDFIITGALTELNYNIVSGGTQLFVTGIGGGAKMVVINVALDMRVVNSRTFGVDYVTSLQKQIYGYEVEAGVFRFFGTTLVQFDAGAIKNEPLQLGVRSVVEMAVYQIMTDFLHLPKEQKCDIVQTDHMARQLDRLSAH
ncbi:MAG TPA: CsgG/HfaB family protein [Parvibaculum sp.]|uniref:CsgG/HfaB family protein n=1 Tax=Parvibaculum sp. TaxID=2024848 RepID=UPI002BE94554|nr:CsgG/HfaB family protein [Parvibaculum sp.]HMM13573.1 CsgG/HfaB family protein [Parvibaculum sp.]